MDRASIVGTLERGVFVGILLNQLEIGLVQLIEQLVDTEAKPSDPKSALLLVLQTAHPNQSGLKQLE
jgi:hypothetical protein